MECDHLLYGHLSHCSVLPKSRSFACDCMIPQMAECRRVFKAGQGTKHDSLIRCLHKRQHQDIEMHKGKGVDWIALHRHYRSYSKWHEGFCGTGLMLLAVPLRWSCKLDVNTQ